MGSERNLAQGWVDDPPPRSRCLVQVWLRRGGHPSALSSLFGPSLGPGRGRAVESEEVERCRPASVRSVKRLVQFSRKPLSLTAPRRELSLHQAGNEMGEANEAKLLNQPPGWIPPPHRDSASVWRETSRGGARSIRSS